VIVSSNGQLAILLTATSFFERINVMNSTSQSPQDGSDATPPDLNDAKLVVVAERAQEAAASILVSVLADEGIRAVAVGGFTAGFRAEAPGWIQVKTLEQDAERARRIIKEIKSAQSLEDTF